MDLNIPVLKSCCWMSLRTGALITGGLQVCIFTLYFLQMLFYIIRYTVLDPIVKFDVLIKTLMLEYVDILNIVFSAFLIIGILKKNSGFVAAWFLVEVTRLIDITSRVVMNKFIYFHFPHLVEELIFIGLEATCAWIGYSYYTTMPKKSKYIF